MLDIVSLEKAKELFGLASKTLIKKELLPLSEAAERVLAGDVISRENVPEFLRSTMDGYAVRCEDTFGASEAIPAALFLKGSVEMGVTPKLALDVGEACYIPTGGMLPEGADSVEMMEYSERLGEEVLLNKPVKYNENVITIGEDVKRGEMVFKKGELITPQILGSLASMGISEVEVYKKIKVYFIASGDELTPYDLPSLPLGKIREANNLMLISLLAPYCESVGSAIIKDDIESFVRSIEYGLSISDMVVLSGGSSVGVKDFAYKAIEKLKGEFCFHGVGIKPGKPTMAAKTEDGKLIIGLPGNTMAALMSADLIVKEKLADNMFVKPKSRKISAKASINFPSSAGRTTIMPVMLERIGSEYFATPVFNKAWLISSLGKADGYVVIDAIREGIYQNESIEVTVL